MDFLPHSFSHTVEESRTTTKDNILEKIFSYVDIALLYGVIAVFMDTFEIESGFLWFEHYFGSLESLVSDQDFTAIWKFVVLLASVGILSFFKCGIEVVDNIAHFFFDVPDNFDFGISGERITSLVQYFLQISSDVSTSKMDSLDSMRDGITFIDWDSV